MKTLNEFRIMIRMILGDQAGRRYSDDMIDLALREALSKAAAYIPRRELCRVKVEKRKGYKLILRFIPEPGELLAGWNGETGEPLGFISTQNGMITQIEVFAGTPPNSGGTMLLEFGCIHTISGLDGAAETTLPDSHALTICRFAAGIALEIRARSVAEVFGKRPEDTERLLELSDRLKADSLDDLSIAALKSGNREPPWPQTGWSERYRF